ncbi:hypothetical protein SCB29_35665, partial [Paraburkholderia sp. SIMBA_055]
MAITDIDMQVPYVNTTLTVSSIIESRKTTTINILTTLTRADAGAVAVAGWDVHTHAVEVQRRISLTGQAAAVDDALTATENVVMFARLAGLGRAAAARRATELITQFD